MSTTFDAPTAHLADISGDYTIDPSHSRLGFVAVSYTHLTLPTNREV